MAPDVMLLALPMGVNLIILGPVLAYIRSGARADPVFGPDTAARRILACVYAAIAGASLVALTGLALAPTDQIAPAILAVMCLQILYKTLTLPTLGLRHAVARVNFAVVCLFCGVIWAWAAA